MSIAETSLYSGLEARARASDIRVAGAVRALMVDGVERTDEEIHAALENIAWRPDRTRHGRKVLSDQGTLLEVGRKKLSTGGTGRIWKMNKEDAA